MSEVIEHEATKASHEEIEKKVASAFSERDQAIRERDEAVTSRKTYIIHSEIREAFKGEVIDPEVAMRLLLGEYQFGISEEGQISIKDSKGNPIRDKANKPATLQWIVKCFIEKYPYLSKPNESTGTEDGIPKSMKYLERPRSQWTESEIQHALQMVAERKIILRDGKWIAR